MGINPPMHPDEEVDSFALLGVMGLVIIGCVAGIWGWTMILDRYEHDPGRVRAFLFLLLTATMAFDVGLYCQRVTYPSVLCLSLLASVWGGLDAVLRFPAVHNFESFFALKQITLLVGKTLAYIFGMVSFQKHAVFLMVAIFVNTWGLMLLYFMAFPMDIAEQIVRHDEYDVDLAVRLWQLVAMKHERQRCLSIWTRWWHRRVASASKRSSLAQWYVRVADPHVHQTFYRARHV